MEDLPSMSFLSVGSSPSCPRRSREMALTEGAELRSHRPSLMRLQQSGTHQMIPLVLTPCKQALRSLADNI